MEMKKTDFFLPFNVAWMTLMEEELGLFVAASRAGVSIQSTKILLCISLIAFLELRKCATC